MNKIGVVFAGGGGKGAYEVGVWRAMQEAGICPQVVAGTSIGALNGAALVQENLTMAHEIWSHIAAKDVLSLNMESLPDSLARSLSAKGLDLTKLPLTFRTRGLFSQQGLLDIMSEHFDFQQLSQSPTQFFVSAHNKIANKVEYFLVNQRPEEEIRNILLSSCALPGIFDDIKIGEAIYTDGGWYWGLPHKQLDNTPVLPVYGQGCDLIILVCLSRDDLIAREQYPDARILPVVPSADLGGLIDGVVDFSNEGALRRLELGYQDGRKIFNQLASFLENDAIYERLWQELAAGEETVRANMQRHEAAMQGKMKLHQAIDSFNQAVFADKFEEDITVPVIAAQDLLTEGNRNLLAQIEQRDLGRHVEEFLAKNLDNSQDIQDAVLEAVTCLAAQEGQCKGLQEEGFLSRIVSGFTGKSQKLLAQNQQDLARAQFAAISLIKHVQAKQVLTFEMTVAINNRVNWLFGEMAALHERVSEECVGIYRSLSLVFSKLRHEILVNHSRIDALENRVSKLEWKDELPFYTMQGRAYHSLSLVEKVVCIVNDFYFLTGGQWDLHEMRSLKSALSKLEVLDKPLSLGEFFSALAENPKLATRFTARLSLQEEAQKELLVTAVKRLQAGGVQDAQAVQAWLEKEGGYPWTAEIPCYHFAVQLLHGLQRNGYMVRENQEKNLDSLKHAYLKELDMLKSLVEKYKLSDHQKQTIADLRNRIETYRLSVPLIGAFSSGKTSLLNRYLGTDVFATEMAPETAIASELYFAEAGMEKVVAHYVDGNQQEYPLSDMAQLGQQGSMLLYQEVHLHNTALAAHPDIVLVDMPGLDSTIPAHNKAILNYIKEGVTFILCVATDQTLKQSVLAFLQQLSLYQLDFSVLMTKREMRQPEDLPALQQNMAKSIREITQQEAPIGSVSAWKGQLDDFYNALERIEARKKAFLQEQFVPEIQSLREQIKQTLSLLANQDNLSAQDLARKKEELTQNMQELDRIMAKEKEQVMRECRENLPASVAGDVQYALQQSKGTLKADLKRGQGVDERVRGIVQNTFRISVNAVSQKVFSQSAQKVSRYVARYVYGAEAGTADFCLPIGDLPKVTANGILSIAGGASLGFLLGGPIGALIGGLLGLFYKEKKEKELENALQSMIGEVASHVQEAAATCLTDMAERFWTAVEEKVRKARADMELELTKLEEQLKKNAVEVQEQRKQIQSDLAVLEQRNLAGMKLLQ
ncbi:MAG: patatin-like phospholipase family protein [Anaeromusa sp.]|uniref:patatin-like phospholipase family protein n=1 Tax=Anaeromusa sp. TaxID=1872520 RepID=UPI002B2148E6|nr:patatin-like phospholipase family protein [Anaeromusa sp.]MEA4836413.1 patatin-like phospholipase family protein [Anaeromusa sp.]